MSIKQQITHQWSEWMSIIAGILGPLTSLVFEEKYTPKQILARLLIGAASAMFLGSYLSEQVQSVNFKSLLIYMSGFGGYYVLKGVLKILEMFGLDPVKGINYIWIIIKSAKPSVTQNKTNENNTENPGSTDNN
jgi:hypothetical protein